MAKDMTSDMTEGNPLGLIVRFAIPMLIGGVFQQIYNVIDMLIIGNVEGSRDLAAIGATSSATFFFLSLAIGLTMAFSIVCAQYFGAKNYRMLRVSLASSAYITLVATIIMSAAGILGAGPLMRLLGTPAEIIDSSTTYIQICIGGGIGLMVYNAAAAVLRAVGDSKTPLYFLILSSLLNVVLDLVFVLGFRMGVTGVAIATVLAQIVSALLCVIYMFRRYPMFRLHRIDLKPVWANVWHIGKIGLSMGLQTFFLSIGDMIITSAVNAHGTDVVAAFSTGNRVQQFATLLFFIFTEAFAVYAGQNLGARKLLRIRDGFRQLIKMLLVICLASALLIFVFGDTFVGWFISRSDPHFAEIIAIARGYLRICAVFYPFLALILLYNNALRGMGDVLYPLASGIVELVAKVGLSLYLGYAFGYVGVWFANPIGWVLGIIPTMIRYHTDGWEKLAGKFASPEATESVRILSQRFLP